MMTSKGKDSLIASLQKGCLSPEKLDLKIGAIVMCTKNNQQKGYVNGTLGTVKGFESGTKYPIIETRRGEKIVIEPTDWIIEENGKPKANITQIPLRLAWAITIHKSQGMSLDAAIMDLGEIFEYGQGYVALSRVRAFSGLHLLGWNRQAFQVHPRILEKDKIFMQLSESARVVFGDMPKEKLVEMQSNFILSSGGTMAVVKKKDTKKGKINTLDATLMLVLQEKSIAQISKERDMAPITILGHIEKLVTNNKLEKDDIKYLIDQKTALGLKDIKTTFLNYDTTKLTPIFEHYKGKYSFDQLRLARMVLSFN